MGVETGAQTDGGKILVRLDGLPQYIVCTWNGTVRAFQAANRGKVKVYAFWFVPKVPGFRQGEFERNVTDDGKALVGLPSVATGDREEGTGGAKCVLKEGAVGEVVLNNLLDS